MDNNSWRLASRNHASSNDFHSSDYNSTSGEIFKLHIPLYFKDKIDFKNPQDPLLLQVMPNKHEKDSDNSFCNDPVGDLASKKAKGVIHKYKGRVLLIATGACAINCRYCFRREFPYSTNNASSNNWKEAIRYLNEHKDIHEVILSGGDPLMLSTKVLTKFTEQLQLINHIKTLRIHTRTPLVSPSRITDNFINWLSNIPLKKVMVFHSNHPKELADDLIPVLKKIKKTNTLLLNQSVLLKNINDNSQILIEHCHRLFSLGILPYYLNQLDKVQGASHFYVSKDTAKSIHKQLLESLPGYLVPKLVEEISGKMNKSPIF